MAEIAVQKIEHPWAADVKVYKWPALAANDTGEPLVVPHRADVTVHMHGTFGGAVTLEGSCDPAAVLADFVGLRDVNDVAISMTGKDIRAVQENVYAMRPVAAAAVSAVDVFVLVK